MSVDTINSEVMRRAREALESVSDKFLSLHGIGSVVHTVTITLNGTHGGADVIIEGFDEEGVDLVITVPV